MKVHLAGVKAENRTRTRVRERTTNWPKAVFGSSVRSWVGVAVVVLVAAVGVVVLVGVCVTVTVRVRVGVDVAIAIWV